MKKLIFLLGLAFVMLFGSASANAQYRHDNGRHRGWERHDRYEQRRNSNDYSRIEVRNEYRYVQYYGAVYKEVYRSTYRIDRFGREQVINRVLIRRERYNDYDRYGRNRNGLRFNIFLRF